jgi:thiosulfate dehydrogenase [quinone] large subunit
VKGAQRALAAIRIVVGAWFLKAIVSKFTWSEFPPQVSERWIGFMPIRLREWLDAGPPDWYARLVLEDALRDPTTLATLTAVGEVLVGLGLLLGLLTGLASLGGLWLMVNYVLASWGTGLNQQGFHILLIACLLAFLLARAGRVWGVDGWIVRRRPESLPAKLRLS